MPTAIIHKAAPHAAPAPRTAPHLTSSRPSVTQLVELLLQQRLGGWLGAARCSGGATRWPRRRPALRGRHRPSPAEGAERVAQLIDDVPVTETCRTDAAHVRRSVHVRGTVYVRSTVHVRGTVHVPAVCTSLQSARCVHAVHAAVRMQGTAQCACVPISGSGSRSGSGSGLRHAHLIVLPAGDFCITRAPSLKMRTCGRLSALYFLCAVAHRLWPA